MPAGPLAAAASRLLPMLRQSGAGMLVDIVRNRAPGVADVVEQVAGAFGVDATPGAIAERFAGASPRLQTELLQRVKEVEDSGVEHWKAMVAEINETMRAELTAKDWLQRNWRPIFALSTIALLPIYVLALFWLLLTGRGSEAGIFANALMLLLPLQLGVLGVYAGGRSWEKARGAAQ